MATAAAKGEHIALFDHDNLLLNTAIDVMVKAALKTSALCLTVAERGHNMPGTSHGTTRSAPSVNQSLPGKGGGAVQVSPTPDARNGPNLCVANCNLNKRVKPCQPRRPP